MQIITQSLDKISLKRNEKYGAYHDQILAFTIHGKNKKSQTKIINLKYELQN